MRSLIATGAPARGPTRSAAAVAAGLAAGALGTDTGGSVRVPAALCGIVGLKVTHGRVPLTGVFPLAASLDTVGPMARTVADTALLYQAIAGEDPADPWSAARPVTPVGGPAPIAGLRVGVPVPWVEEPVTDEVRVAFRATLDRLADLGARGEEVISPSLASVPSVDVLAAYFAPEVAAVHRRWFRDDPERYGAEVRDRIAPVFDVDADASTAARTWRVGLRHVADRLLAEHDVLATPATAATRKEIGVDTIDVAGAAAPYRPVLARFSSLVNVIGNPGLVLPMALPGDPPPALQLIGARWAEHRLLEIGLALEEAGVSEHRPPPVW